MKSFPNVAETRVLWYEPERAIFFENLKKQRSLASVAIEPVQRSAYSAMMAAILLFLMVPLLSATYTVAETIPSVTSYLSESDKIRLKNVIDPGLNLQDLLSTHTTQGYKQVYTFTQGYKLLEETIPDKEKICNYLSKSLGDNNNLVPEAAFYIVSIWKIVNTCPSLPVPTITKVLMSTIEKDTSTFAESYYALSTLTLLSQKLTDDKADKLAKRLQVALRKDDSLWNLGYTFHIASELGPIGQFAFDHIEDAIIQADEVNGQFLQFEGGLSITSFLVNGIFKLSSSLKKRPPLTSPQIVKLTNYLLSRRSVQTPKGVLGLLSALNTLAVNEFETPVCITLPDGVVVSNKQPFVTVKVCNIFGKPLATIPKVIANSATKIEDDTVIITKETLQPSTADKTLFTLDFMKAKPDRGFYKISILAGSVNNTIKIKVLSEVLVDYLEIGTGDADQTTQPKLSKVVFPEKLNQKIEADSQQKLVVRFLLRDAANKKLMRVHQAFIRLSSVSSSNSNKKGNEIIFVAEPDSSHVYKFDMPLTSAAVNFGHVSGDYNIDLIIGDAVLSNSFQWSIGTVNLKFPDAIAAESNGKNVSYKRKQDIYTTKPEIRHMFREPEKRPPAFVSNLFTGLCLAPALLLFILWAKLGVNISNFPLSISAVVFHLGLGSIFVLFGIFWLKLNMFVTLRYLLGLGLVTFLAGNKLLSNIAHRHKLSH